MDADKRMIAHNYSKQKIRDTDVSHVETKERRLIHGNLRLC